MPSSGPPYTESIDGDITGIYGFKDGRVELAIRLPKLLALVLNEFRRTFTEEEFLRFKAAVEKISKWYDLPLEERQRLGAP